MDACRRDLKEKQEVILLEERGIHLLGDGKCVLVLHKGTKGVVEDIHEHLQFKGKAPDKKVLVVRVRWRLAGFDVVAQVYGSWKIEGILGMDTRVRTLRPLHDDQYSEVALRQRRWGVGGAVVDYHDGHGLCYDVRHDDGTMGSYDPDEIEVEDEEKTLEA